MGLEPAREVGLLQLNLFKNTGLCWAHALQTHQHSSPTVSPDHAGLPDRCLLQALPHTYPAHSPIALNSTFPSSPTAAQNHHQAMRTPLPPGF